MIFLQGGKGCCGDGMACDVCVYTCMWRGTQGESNGGTQCVECCKNSVELNSCLICHCPPSLHACDRIGQTHALSS